MSKFVLVMLAVLIAVTFLLPAFAVAEPVQEAPVSSRTVFFRPHLSIYHNRYYSNGAYMEKALGGGFCTPTWGGWCKAQNTYGKTFYVKWCNYPRCVRW